MANPPPYKPSYSFAGYQTTNPSKPLPGLRVDTEYNNIATSITGTQAALADIRRDDGKLKNGIVTPEALAPGMAYGVLPPVPWASGVTYTPPQAVWQGNKLYQCILKHVSTVFATDLANKCWNLVLDFQPPIDAAAASAAAAAASAAAAAGSATAANNSKAAAATSATNAATSETNALASKNAAAASATTASTAATTATTEANRAKSEADRAKSISDAMLPDAPSNGTAYGRKNGAWSAVLEAAAYTAADVLTKLKTVDGASSGLDADLLDGLNSSFFAPVNNPALTGVPTAPTPGVADNSTQIATTAFVKANDALLAPINNPALTGVPTAPVAAPGTNTAQLATTSFVAAALGPKITDAPADGANYGRKNNAWVATLADALTDNKYYARRNGVWAEAAPLAGPVFTGDPQAPTPATGDNDTSIATTAFVKAQGYITPAALVPYAPLASPVLTGNPTAPTPSPGDNDTSLATTQFVVSALVAADAVATAQTRNRVVNPAFQISQEVVIGVAATVSQTYAADQWQLAFATTGSTTAVVTDYNLAGVGNYLRLNSSTTPDAAVAAGDYAMLFQKVEGICIDDFQWGTVDAKPAVLRFRARAFGNGGAPVTIGVSIRATIGSFSFAKNVMIANGAWNDFVIPVPACTIGSWATDNTAVALLGFAGMAGSTFNGGTDGTWTATNSMACPGNSNIMAMAQTGFDIANVGLYLDPNNTGLPPPWQMPDEAEELAKCRRYYENDTGQRVMFSGNVTSGSNYSATAMFLVPKRTTPTVTVTNVSAFSFPSTVGSAAAFVTCFRETRAANTTGAGSFISTFAANSRRS